MTVRSSAAAAATAEKQSSRARRAGRKHGDAFGLATRFSLRRPLRYAHADAREMGRVLTKVGGFDKGNVHVLLEPGPEALLAVLDKEIGRLSNATHESMLVFYYSGHADEHALFPKGKALPFGALKTRLSADAVSMRLGIIDTCRGGGWTGTRGLSENEPFELSAPMDLAAEGSVLIA